VKPAAVKRAGFPPVARQDAVVLILGSLPGEESLRRQQYYAHKSNQFWWIMGELVGALPELPYEARLDRLRDSRIALWDVCAAAERSGSLDSNIRDPEANDFAGFFAEHPLLRRICFNGGKAATLFHRMVTSPLPAAIQCTQLPSTSPAHATLSRGEKLTQWRDGGCFHLDPNNVFI